MPGSRSPTNLATSSGVGPGSTPASRSAGRPTNQAAAASVSETSDAKIQNLNVWPASNACSMRTAATRSAAAHATEISAPRTVS